MFGEERPPPPFWLPCRSEPAPRFDAERVIRRIRDHISFLVNLRHREPLLQPGIILHRSPEGLDFLPDSARCCFRWRTTKAKVLPSNIKTKIVAAFFIRDSRINVCLYTPGPVWASGNRQGCHKKKRSYRVIPGTIATLSDCENPLTAAAAWLASASPCNLPEP